MTKYNQEMSKMYGISSVTYYESLDFENAGFMDRNLFVVKLELGENKQVCYEIYNEYSELIATIDARGNITFQEEYLEALRQVNEEQFDTLNLRNAKFELPKELGEQDLSLTPEELEEARVQEKLETIEDTLGVQDIRAYSEAALDQPLSTQEPEEIDSQDQARAAFENITNQQELEADVRVTQTETLADMIPEVKQKGFVKIGVVYSDRIPGKNNGRFSFVGITKEGQIQEVESLQNIDGTTTGQKVTAMNSRDGSVIEEEQVAGMMRLEGRNGMNGQEEYLSVKMGQYGIIEVDYVRAELGQDKSTRYFSAPIETQHQKPTTTEVRRMMDKTKNTSLQEEQQKSEPEIERDGQTQIENIDEIAENDQLGYDDIIVLEDGKETTIRREAAKDKVTPQEFLKKYKQKGSKTPDEAIESVHREIEEDYRGRGDGREMPNQ